VPHQSAKQQKIDIVMDEFKDGTLRSGGSNKKVTNPKQAIAIAMSEAERLAGGGYIGEPRMNEYMNRPMFQTPQMREGGGIMAGVAPVNMDEGGFMDWVSDTAEEYNPFPDNFFTASRTEAGSGITLRDITDALLVDPEDPVDVALTTATAGLLASGIGAPGALVAQLARMGYKGKKVYDMVDKAVSTVVPVLSKTAEGGQDLKSLLKNQGKIDLARTPAYLTNDPEIGFVDEPRTWGDASDFIFKDINPFYDEDVAESIVEEEGGIASLPEVYEDYVPPIDPEVLMKSNEELIDEMLPPPSPTEETISEGIESLVVDDDDKKKRRRRRDRLSKDTGWFPGKRILRGIRNIGDDERWLAADGGLAAPQHFAVGGIAKLTAKYGPEIGQTLKKVADQFGEGSYAFKAMLKSLTGDVQTKMLPKMSAETLGISSKATKKQREAAAKLKKTKEKAEAKSKKAEAKKVKDEETLAPVEPEVKSSLGKKIGKGLMYGIPAVGVGSVGYNYFFGDDEEEAPAEEVVEEKMTVTEQVDEPRQWREIFTNLGDLPGEFRDTIVNSMDRIKEDPVYRRAMLAAFRAMTTPQAGYVPFNSLSEAVGAYYSEMDAIEGRKSEFELTKEALSDAYPDLSEGELTKMALGRSKADYIRDELSLFTQAYPNVNVREETIFIDPKKEELGKMSQYDLIAQRANMLEEQGII